jgi:hypothetical protein
MTEPGEVENISEQSSELQHPEASSSTAVLASTPTSSSSS